MKKSLLALALTGVLTGMSLLTPAKSIPYTTLNEISRQAKKVAKEIRYEKDIGFDQWSAPSVTRAVKFGDCEDYALLLKDDLAKRGIRTEFKNGKRAPQDKEGHAWIEYTAVYPGEVYVIESTSGNIYNKKSVSRKGYYQSCSDESMRGFFKGQIESVNKIEGRKIL